MESGVERRSKLTSRKEIHSSYIYRQDHSQLDSCIDSAHHYYDAVVGEHLITFIKDEGATESFISGFLLELIGCKDKIKPLGDRASRLRGIGGSAP